MRSWIGLTQQDHIQEIIDKWLAIDDEIWAKIICMERNRRIAKAYARKHSLTINGSEDEYLDGTTLGLNSFDNPDRDTKTRHIKEYIGQGLRIKITQNGDILVKRLSKANIFLHRQHQHSGFADRIKSSNSSSDLYAINSESGDLYGVMNPLHRLSHNTGPLSNLSSSSQYLFSNFNGSSNRALMNGNSNGSNGLDRHKFSVASSSDASTSSSSNGFGHGKSSANSMAKQAQVAATSGGHRIGSSAGGKPTNRFGERRAIQETIDETYSSIVLEHNKPMKIFDMARFKSMLERESRRPYPNRRLLQSQCISIISFVVDDHKMLNLPSWIMIFNIVAIDLLKIELGLLDSPGDLFLSGPLPPSLSDPAASGRRFGQHLTEHRGPDSEVSSPPSSSVAPSRNGAMSRHYHERRFNATQSQLIASKKAFANAAALGAYNGEHCNGATTDSQTRSTQMQQPTKGSRLQRYINRFERGAGETEGNLATSVPAIKASLDREHLAAEKKEHLLLTDTTETQQASSSSSGFNSHCSSQNDSSAASSSSNIAASATGAPDEHSTDQEQVDLASRESPSSQTSKALLYKHQIASRGDLVGTSPDGELGSQLAAKSRGKRPPKLPHRLAAPGSRPAMSEPMPIPAPPTSSGGGPSGKANLILVSPTGLSPPLPKRMGHLAAGGGCVNPRNSSPIAKSRSQLNGDSPNTVPEFGMIKHIDENGRCSVLMNDADLAQQRDLTTKPAPRPLPAGIPAHAQLAPPATQRHILRYLMSATRGKLAEQIGRSQQQCQQFEYFAPSPIRYQRPLPIVPNQNLSRFPREHKEEESLYYCGLQARVSNKLRMQQAPLKRHLVNPKSPSSALSAILTDFRRNSNQQYGQPGEPYRMRQHISLTSLEDGLEVQMNPYRSQQRHYSKSNLSSPKQSGSQSITRPLLKFFKPNLGAANKSSTSKMEGENQAAGSMFLSVDNLTQPSQKLNLAVKGLPLKLKRTKTKKPTKDG